MAKTRINVRIDPELWEAAGRYAAKHGIDRTAVLERGLEAVLGVNGRAERPVSPKLRQGVIARPKRNR